MRRLRSDLELLGTTLKIADFPVSRRWWRGKSDFSTSPIQEIRHRTRPIHHPEQEYQEIFAIRSREHQLRVVEDWLSPAQLGAPSTAAVADHQDRPKWAGFLLS